MIIFARTHQARGQILRRNQNKSLLAIHRHLYYSFALKFLIIQTHATSYDFYSSGVLVVELPMYAVKEKGGKPDRKPYPLPYGQRNSCINRKYVNSQDYAQKPQQNCTFMKSASVGVKRCSVGSHEVYERCRVSSSEHFITVRKIIWP
jgi:hypothetical protein